MKTTLYTAWYKDGRESIIDKVQLIYAKKHSLLISYEKRTYELDLDTVVCKYQRTIFMLPSRARKSFK